MIVHMNVNTAVYMHMYIYLHM